MHRYLTISFLLFLFCSSFYAFDWTKADGVKWYQIQKDRCIFPFQYLGNTYNDCTTDGDVSDRPWCSITKDYKGYSTYCYNFRNSSLKCLPSYKWSNGKTYTGCDYLLKGSTYKQCIPNDPTLKLMYCLDPPTTNSQKPLINLDNCDPALKKVSEYPALCLGPSEYAVPVPLTDGDKSDILDVHNTFRGEVSAAYMFQLYWDDELAKIAQAHANMCAFDHDLAENRISLMYLWKNGQNMVMASEPNTPPADLVYEMLDSEKVHFRYNNTCSPDPSSCLHYTQSMLSNLTRVGCGQTHCIYPDRMERFLVCNYIHSQYTDNYMIPYVPSKVPASACPKFKSGNLCNCGNKICKYLENEYLEPATCTCKKPLVKRSIAKREAIDDRPDISPSSFVVRRSLPQLESRDVAKRSINIISQNGLAKQHFPKNGLPDRKQQKQVVHDINAAEAGLAKN